MPSRSVSRALERAFRASLLAGAPVLASCGGSLVVVDDGGSPQSCTVSSTTPVANQKLTPCDTFEYPFVIGPECAPDSATYIGTYGLSRDQCAALCPPQDGATAFMCYLDVSSAEPLLACTYGVCSGFGRRAPATPAASSSTDAPVPSGYFGRAAALEAESVTAFRTLARELAAHGAPHRLRTNARRAAREEARHTRAMSALDRHRGTGRVRIPRCPSDVRSLEAIACDNLAEGCVRETYGAVVARLQAEQTAGPSLRATLRSIARDEASHATFSWALARWIDERLGPDERDRARQSREEAVRGLRASIERLPEARDSLGLPSRAQALRIFEALDSALWSVPE